MTSPSTMRHASYAPWPLQSDGWDPKFMGSSRFSSYATKSQGFRYEPEALRLNDPAYAHWPRESISSPMEFSWQQSSGFPFPTNPQQRRDFPDSPHHHVHDHGHVKASMDHVGNGKTTDHESSSSTLASSTIAAGQKAHTPKRHVKSACNNCKKAHLSCDVHRPCTRCVQTNKTEGCYDVPQRRKGRPRLRQDSLRKSGRSAITKPLTAKPLIAVHQHGQYPMQSLAYHHGYSTSIDPYNVYPSVPMVYLGIIGTEFRIMQANQAFRGFFEFNGDLHGRGLDQIVDSSDYNRLQHVCYAMRDAIEKEMSTSMAPLSVVDQYNLNRLPVIDSMDPSRYSKPVFTKREPLRFRFANGMRQYEVDFVLSKTDVLFITLVLPAIRTAPMVLPSSQQTQHAMVSPGMSSYTQQTFDPSRLQYGRQFERTSLLPLPSPDTSGPFSTSPTSSYSMGSTTSSLPASSRHPSVVSHLSYDNAMLPASMNNGHIAPGQVEGYQKYLVLNSTLSPSQSTTSTLPAASAGSGQSGQSGPLQDRRDLVNASRKLPPIPGLVGSPDSQTSDNAGSQGLRTQQNYWQGKDPEQPSKGDNKAASVSQAQVESPSRRSRMDVKELAS